MTGDDDDMATGDNGSHCACTFGSLCPCVKVRPLTLQLALRARRRRWQRGGSGARFAHLAWGRLLTRRLALRDGATTTTMAKA